MQYLIAVKPERKPIIEFIRPRATETAWNPVIHKPATLSVHAFNCVDVETTLD